MAWPALPANSRKYSSQKWKSTQIKSDWLQIWYRGRRRCQEDIPRRSSPKDQGNSEDLEIHEPSWGFLNFAKKSRQIVLVRNLTKWVGRYVL